jgi:hypothetical protein
MVLDDLLVAIERAPRRLRLYMLKPIVEKLGYIGFTRFNKRTRSEFVQYFGALDVCGLTVM